MNHKEFSFTNGHGQTLSGRLELPPEPTDRVALFAHCFTCGKDILAAARISRALAAKGWAVLRFDFTGLGSSQGDFSNTNFSSNLDDLVHAAGRLQMTGTRWSFSSVTVWAERRFWPLLIRWRKLAEW